MLFSDGTFLGPTAGEKTEAQSFLRKGNGKRSPIWQMITHKSRQSTAHIRIQIVDFDVRCRGGRYTYKVV